MGSDLMRIMEQVGRDKGIDRAILVEALEAAMLSAAKKKRGQELEIEAHFNEELGEIELFEFKKVVETVENEEAEIAFDEARAYDPEVDLGDQLGVKLDTAEFGRIAAQAAKQIIIQKVRDAERELIYKEFKDKKGEIVNGAVLRFERGAIVVNLGRTEAALLPKDQIQRENYRQGERIRALVMDIQLTTRGPQILLSRGHPDFLVKLFRMEVPEIYEGIVEVRKAVREPGVRGKIAVVSYDKDVDPVGACVGVKGARVQAVVQELRGEKIDIVPWSDDIVQLACASLAPAEVSQVIVDEKRNTLEIIVADDQLSLAIGKRGQNVKLASRLLDWKIDVKSETKVARQYQQAHQSLGRIPGMGLALIDRLYSEGYICAADVARAEPADLLSIEGITEDKTALLIEEAKKVAEVEAREAAEAAHREAEEKKLAELEEELRRLAAEMEAAAAPPEGAAEAGTPEATAAEGAEGGLPAEVAALPPPEAAVSADPSNGTEEEPA